jgi:plasmid stabilization system protein ParE
MKLKLYWSEKAVRDLNTIYDYYFSKSPAVGTRFYNTILDEAERLTKNPLLGGGGRPPFR